MTITLTNTDRVNSEVTIAPANEVTGEPLLDRTSQKEVVTEAQLIEGKALELKQGTTQFVEGLSQSQVLALSDQFASVDLLPESLTANLEKLFGISNLLNDTIHRALQEKNSSEAQVLQTVLEELSVDQLRKLHEALNPRAEAIPETREDLLRAMNGDQILDLLKRDPSLALPLAKLLIESGKIDAQLAKKLTELLGEAALLDTALREFLGELLPLFAVPYEVKDSVPLTTTHNQTPTAVSFNLMLIKNLWQRIFEETALETQKKVQELLLAHSEALKKKEESDIKKKKEEDERDRNEIEELEHYIQQMKYLHEELLNEAGLNSEAQKYFRWLWDTLFDEAPKFWAYDF